MINKDLLKKYQPTLSDTALDNFDKYAAHLVERNKQMNLTGITEPDEIVINTLSTASNSLNMSMFRRAQV